MTVEWRFAGDPRPIRGEDEADVVATLRLRCAAGLPAPLRSGPLGPFCAWLAARSEVPPVDPDQSDLDASMALLRALAQSDQAAPVTGRLRLLSRSELK